MKVFSAILAGGNGTRFWPLSRTESPKQLLNLSGNDVMINETIKRCQGIIDSKDVFIVTAQNQLKSVDKVLIESIPRENILLEPYAMNTAPSILLAALQIKKQHQEGVMCVFPSDQHITNQSEFNSVLEKAVEYAQNSKKLVTIGITPTFPSTGYGYIRCGDELKRHEFGSVYEFCEKPSYDTAKTYITSGKYLWNSGIFVFKISTILDAFERYLPRAYSRLSKWFESEDKESFPEVFKSLPKISIDYGILERSEDIVVTPGDFGWNDVGSWDSLGAIFPPDENRNIVRSETNVLLGTSNCIIYSENQLVTTNGIDNLIIVSTKDALLVCDKQRAQDVRKIVDTLSEKGLSKYL